MPSRAMSGSRERILTRPSPSESSPANTCASCSREVRKVHAHKIKQADLGSPTLGCDGKEHCCSVLLLCLRAFEIAILCQHGHCVAQVLIKELLPDPLPLILCFALVRAADCFDELLEGDVSVAILIVLVKYSLHDCVVLSRY